jgi:DNA polymerase delta subunit 2
MLEDESGRLKLTGSMLSHFNLCTGCIIAVLGTENQDGAFDVIDIKVVDLPTQPSRWALVKQPKQTVKLPSSKIAIVSGLEFDSGSGDNLTLDLLAEFLMGESTLSESAQAISRLVIAGGSLSDANPVPKREESLKKYAQKDANEPSAWNLSPVKRLDMWLANILPTLPVTLMPGENDPVNASVPQQPLHSAYFANSRTYLKAPNATKTEHSPWFDCVTNPWDGEIEGWRMLATGGQPVNDMFKYVEGDDRLGMMESFLRWRNIAPTAPDTLCRFPDFVEMKANNQQGHIRTLTRTHSLSKTAHMSLLQDVSHSLQPKQLLDQRRRMQKSD